MSLFDIIKYNNIDLTNYEDLESLPVELISLYYSRVHKGWDKSHESMCGWLSFCACLNYNYYSKVFLEILKQYNNEPV